MPFRVGASIPLLAYKDAQMGLLWTAGGILEAKNYLENCMAMRKMKTLINALRPNTPSLRKAA